MVSIIAALCGDYRPWGCGGCLGEDAVCAKYGPTPDVRRSTLCYDRTR